MSNNNEQIRTCENCINCYTIFCPGGNKICEIHETKEEVEERKRLQELKNKEYIENQFKKSWILKNPKNFDNFAYNCFGEEFPEDKLEGFNEIEIEALKQAMQDINDSVENFESEVLNHNRCTWEELECGDVAESWWANQYDLTSYYYCALEKLQD